MQAALLRNSSGAACSTSYCGRAAAFRPEGRAPRRAVRGAAAAASGGLGGVGSGAAAAAPVSSPAAAAAAEALSSASASRASASIRSGRNGGGGSGSSSTSSSNKRRTSSGGGFGGNSNSTSSSESAESARRMLVLQSAIDKTYRAKLRAFAREASPEALASMRASLAPEQRRQLRAVLEDVSALRREAAREAERSGVPPDLVDQDAAEALTLEEEEVLQQELGVRVSVVPVAAEEEDEAEEEQQKQQAGRKGRKRASAAKAAAAAPDSPPRMMPASFAEYVAALLPPDQAREIAESLGRDVDGGLDAAVASAAGGTGSASGGDGGARATVLVERALRALEPQVLAELCALYDDVRDFEAQLAAASWPSEGAPPPPGVDMAAAARTYLALVKRMEALSARLEERVGGGAGPPPPQPREVVVADAVVEPSVSPAAAAVAAAAATGARQPWGASFSQPRVRVRKASSSARKRGGAGAEDADDPASAMR